MSTQPQPRRTFAIISHPDAGKTTLTEKLLLCSGAIHIAGEVKARGAARHARSDWMEMERSRGISITSSVMTFEHRGVTFNLLDTPGHQDFSEDTYRTLTAVDSAIMVLDAAKGIEAQTRKLFEVCRLRDIPIITFINKMDREARDPFELLEEIEKTLALDVCPMNWPVGMGSEFRGCFQPADNIFLPYSPHHDVSPAPFAVSGAADAAIGALMPAAQHQQLIEETELLSMAGKAFDLQSYREGHLSPVYFGSALKQFGVPSLLQGLYDYAPTPRAQTANTRTVMPDEKALTGFVFKIQANMDKNHRDRVAFVRLCSGTFTRGMKLRHSRSGKQMAVQNPVMFLAQERSLTEEAFAGDILGIPNHGSLRIGDTLTEGEDLQFQGIPSFAPEIIMRVRLDDPMRAKHMRKALEDLAEEGVSQLFKPRLGANWLVGVVGQLQLEVLASRIEAEYNSKAGFEPAPYNTARWISSDNSIKLADFMERNRMQMADDQDGRPVYLARNEWDLRTTESEWPDLTFHKTREQSV